MEHLDGPTVFPVGFALLTELRLPEAPKKAPRLSKIKVLTHTHTHKRWPANSCDMALQGAVRYGEPELQQEIGKHNSRPALGENETVQGLVVRTKKKKKKESIDGQINPPIPLRRPCNPYNTG